MPYPTKALQEYVLKSELPTLGAGIGPPGPAGATGAPGATGASWQPVQSATAPATTNSGTITTAGLTVSRVAPTAAITGVILATGSIAGQQVVVLNESAFSITFGALGASNVSIGTNCLIPAGTHLQFVWDSVTARWYPATVGSISAPPASISFSGQIIFPMFTVGGTLTVAVTGGGYDSGLYDSATYDSGLGTALTGNIVFPMFKVAGSLTAGSGSGAYGDGLYGSGSYGL